MRRVGWDKLFDGFLTSCELRSLKPTRTAFARALEKIGVAPSVAFFIDDKEENVRGAEDFGIRWAFRFTSLACLRRDVAEAIHSVPTGELMQEP